MSFYTNVKGAKYIFTLFHFIFNICSQATDKSVMSQDTDLVLDIVTANHQALTILN